MAAKKITSSLEKLVLAKQHKSPYLGVRALSQLIAKEHKIKISKSAIAKILGKKGLTQRRGPKKASFLYQARAISNCGLILLRCLDSQLGLFDALQDELSVYFGRLKKDTLKKLIILTSFSALINEDVGLSVKRKGFLRLAGLGRLPAHGLSYFNEHLTQNKPTVSLKAVKEAAKFVSAVKFCFNNGYFGFCDGKLTTFWDSPPLLSDFYLSLGSAKMRIQKMLANKAIMIAYTKSFDYLSALVFNFIKGIESGLKRVEFLDEKGAVLEKLEDCPSKLNLFFGYYPPIVSKGANLVTDLKRFKRFSWEELGEFYCSNVLTKFSQPKMRQTLILNNILIKGKKPRTFDWGLLSSANLGDKKEKIGLFLKQYLYLWPYISEDFLRDMETIEKAILSSQKTNDYLSKMIPNRLNFTSPRDLVRIGQILSILFKEMVYGWEPKAKTGDFVLGKGYVKIVLKQAPKELKKKFNKACLYLDGRRAFLV